MVIEVVGSSSLHPSPHPSPRSTGARGLLAAARQANLLPYLSSFFSSFFTSGNFPTSGVIFSRSQMLRKRTGLPWN